MFSTPVAKRQKIGDQLSIVFDEHGPFAQAPTCFGIAIELAKKILSSKTYAETFAENVSDCDQESFDNGLKSTYYIKMASIKSCVTSYCWVTRQDPENETTVFFNPLLIMSLLLRQGNQSTLDNQIIFVAVKLVHEISHILHWTSSNSLRTSKKGVSSEKDFQDTIKEVRKGNPVTYTKPVTYKDFGEIIEREVFGGLVELKSDNVDALMDLVRVGFYKSKETMYGKFVDSAATRQRFDRTRTKFFYLIETEEEFVSTSSPEFCRVKLQGEQFRLSEGTGDVVVVDQEEGEGGGEEERDVMVMRKPSGGK